MRQKSYRYSVWKKKTQKNKQNKESHLSKNGNLKIKDFINNLLKDDKNDVIMWLDESQKIFKFTQPQIVASLWGKTKQKKDKKEMTYDKISRALRYLYKSKELKNGTTKTYISIFGMISSIFSHVIFCFVFFN